MRSILTLVAASAFLVACGGGDGGSASGGASGLVETPATLTQANYVAVAQEALSSSAYLTTATDLVSGAQVSNPEVLIRFGQAQLPKLSHWLAGAPAQAAGVIESRMEACAGGGSLTLSVNDTNGNHLPDVGDSVALTATNCSFEGEMVNGQLVLTFNSITGNPDYYPYAFSVNLAFNNLVAQSASIRTVGNGNLTLSINARAVNDQSLGLRTASFALVTNYSGTTYSTALTNYQASENINPAGTGFTSTTSVSGALSSSAFESKFVTIATPISFVRSSTQNYPGSGQMFITGAAGSKIRVTVTNTTTLLIELDADANGSYETSTSKLWSEML